MVQQMNQIQRGLDARFGNTAPQLEIPQELQQEFFNAKTEEERQETREKIMNNLVEQTPNTWLDKINSWRYLAMLGNPRTHIRNIIGNALFAPVVSTKNVVATALEKTFLDKNAERTKDIINPFNKKDAHLVELGKKAFDDIHGGIKNVSNNKKYKIENIVSGKTGFSNKTRFGKVMNYLINKNSDFLGQEDNWFKKGRYASSYAQYIKSNNIDINDITEEQLARADEYAWQEALKATYNDFNVVANKLNELSKESRTAKFFKDAIVPFTNTPFNIVRRGVRYSPIGLAESLTNEMYKLKKGTITANEVIDNIASGLTGSGIFLLGALLNSLGILRTKDDDKDRKQKYDEFLGEQDYSLNYGNGSFTIDWAEPVIMPLAMGAEIYNALKDLDGVEGFSVMDALANVSTKAIDPVIETSMLQGLQTSLKSYSNSGGEYFGDVILNAVASYVNQFFPTLGGQVGRTLDDTRRTTYPNSGLIEKTGRQILNKIPGASKLNEPYIDMEGQEVKNEDLGLGMAGRAIQNFLLPGYYSSNKADEYDNEMYRLYNETGEVSALPSSATTRVEYDNEKYKLLGKDYTNYAKQKYQTESQLVEDFIDSSAYQYLDDSERVSIIESLRKYANYEAKADYLKSKNVNFDNSEYNSMKDAVDNGVPLTDYLVAKNYYKGLEGDNKKTEYINYINNLDMDSEAKNYMYDSVYGKSKFSGYVNDMKINDADKLTIKELSAQYTKSEEFAYALKEQGLLDVVVEYAKDNDLEYNAVGLSKKAVANYYYRNGGAPTSSKNNQSGLEQALQRLNSGTSNQNNTTTKQNTSSSTKTVSESSLEQALKRLNGN